MRKLVSIFSLVTMIFSTSLLAKEVKSIDWATLNEHVVAKEIANPFEELEISQIRQLQQIAIIDDLKANGQEIDEKSLEIGAKARKDLEAAGINIEELFKARQEIIAQREHEFASTNPALDNAEVKMSGFLLPLEFEGKKVKEFLLVPYVGACIHEPPPAPNQIVYAKLDTPFEIEDLGMFTAVEIEGLMLSETTNPELNLVDGAKEIPTAYTINVKNVSLLKPE